MSRGRSRRTHRVMLSGLAATLLIPLAACGGSSTAAGAAPSGGGSGRTALTVLAAASLTDVFKAAGTAYERSHPGTAVTFSFAGSQNLAAQVSQGAPADVLVTANTKTMDSLKKDTRTPVLVARNRLTIATAPGDPKHVRGLADLSNPALKVVLAAPEVPVGNYSRKVLGAQHITVRPVSEEPNVRAVLSKVELGEADAGIVYVTDVESAKGKVGTVTIPDAQNSIASYPAAVLDASRHPAAAADFIAWLGSAQGQAILHSYGFQRP